MEMPSGRRIPLQTFFLENEAVNLVGRNVERRRCLRLPPVFCSACFVAYHIRLFPTTSFAVLFC